MKNKILYLTRQSIPYIKELRPLVGSVTACILWQQLDFHFASYPDGFYKFVEPCEHQAYKKGDSWSEELGFSAKEFRKAFDVMGIRYISKTQFYSAGEKIYRSNDREAFFCSYHDKMRGLTFYYRNHKYVDRLLDNLIEAVPTAVTDQRAVTVTDQRAVTGQTKGPLRDRPKGRYVTDQRAAHDHDTEITTEITTENTTKKNDDNTSTGTLRARSNCESSSFEKSGRKPQAATSTDNKTESQLSSSFVEVNNNQYNADNDIPGFEKTSAQFSIGNSQAVSDPHDRPIANCPSPVHATIPAHQLIIPIDWTPDQKQQVDAAIKGANSGSIDISQNVVNCIDVAIKKGEIRKFGAFLSAVIRNHKNGDYTIVRENSSNSSFDKKNCPYCESNGRYNFISVSGNGQTGECSHDPVRMEEMIIKRDVYIKKVKPGFKNPFPQRPSITACKFCNDNGYISVIKADGTQKKLLCKHLDNTLQLIEAEGSKIVWPN
jgi:hypothetical protein